MVCILSKKEKEPLDDDERVKKTGLKLSIQKTKIKKRRSWHLVPSFHCK